MSFEYSNDAVFPVHVLLLLEQSETISQDTIPGAGMIAAVSAFHFVIDSGICVQDRKLENNHIKIDRCQKCLSNNLRLEFACETIDCGN